MEEKVPYKKVKKYPMDSFTNQVNALVYTVNIETQEIIFCNEKCTKEFGNIIGLKCHELLEKVTDKYYLDSYDEFHWGENVNEYLNTINNKIYLFSEKVIEDYKKRISVKVRVGVDITTIKDKESKKREQNIKNIETIEALLNSTIESTLVYDSNKKCIKLNDVALKTFGYTKDEMVGKDVRTFIDKDSLPIIKKVLATGYEEPYEITMLRKCGQKFPCIVKGKYIYLNNEKVRVVAILDLSQDKEKDNKIVKLAFYDSLTNLPNRALLQDRVELFLAKLARTKHYGGLIVIDLDHFKNINNTKGHFVGDKILIECAKRLQHLIRSCDTISRFGGDEFFILIDTDFHDKFDAANTIKDISKKILHNIQKPFYIKDEEYLLTASIGISIFDESFSYYEILKCADSAMNFVKKSGRNNYNFFDSALQSQLERKAIITGKLREAIKLKQISIAYQKQVDINTNVVGVEALARWKDEKLGNISPNEFIPIAEESGLIIEFGYYLLEETARVIKKWQSNPERAIWRMSVNVSLSQFSKNDFVFFIEQIIKDYKIDAKLLRLEITESILLNNIDDAISKIDYLKKLGISISIDDFGTGYSSLAYLKKLSIDELKIDKSFIEDILVDDNDEILVIAILDLGNKFGFDVIAEGVETKEIYEKLKKLGCKYFQGFYFSKPLPKERL
ncbi:EAL domain-containing protein [Campylobacterota bacterium DY0563]